MVGGSDCIMVPGKQVAHGGRGQIPRGLSNGRNLWFTDQKTRGRGACMVWWLGKGGVDRGGINPDI